MSDQPSYLSEAPLVAEEPQDSPANASASTTATGYRRVSIDDFNDPRKYIKSEWAQIIPCVGLDCVPFYKLSKEPQEQSTTASEPMQMQESIHPSTPVVQESITPSTPVAEVPLFGLPPRESFDRAWSRLVTFAEKTPLPIVPSLTHLALLADAEINFCSTLRIKPEKYIDVKERMFDQFHLLCTFDAGQTTSVTRKTWSASRAQHVKGINVNKVSHMYNWYNELGLWDHSWLET